MMNNKHLFILMLLISSSVFPVIRNVPGQYTTIQSAINASQNGDTVLVAEGRYFENINFRGKNITVASTFIISGNNDKILNTIIDGSNPVNSDTASCVLIVSGEDSTARLEGFTLTGGKGSKWIDEHGAGIFVEGGGILITQASPVIKNNFIINNEANRRPAGTVSAGGGAIRVGDGSPQIVNNVIMKNRGMYGGGIVLNYCSGTIIKNNIIVDNSVDQYVTGTQTFGGGGLWILEKKPGDSRANIVENNTIIGNQSYGTGGGQAGTGGGMWTGGAVVLFLNNIVWGNFQASGKQITGSAVFSYNNVEDGISGTGNITLDPAFADSSFFISGTSPNIDAGDPSPAYNDPGTGSTAIFPSMGTTRNDIGAYGGPARKLFPAFSSAGLFTSVKTIDFGNILPGNSKTVTFKVYNTGAENLLVNGASSSAPAISIISSFPISIPVLNEDSISISWTPLSNFILQDSLLIFHNDLNLSNPYKIIISGNSNPIPSFFVTVAQINMDTIDVNVPAADTSFYVYNTGTGPDSVYVTLDYNGVNPSNAVSVEPTSFQIAPADSQMITFTVYPSLIERNATDLYLPRIIFDARFSPGITHFVKQIRFRLKGVLTDVNEVEEIFTYKLEQNYPNPFNPVTTITYGISSSGPVTVIIYDVLGNEVVTLVNEIKTAGIHQVQFNGTDLSSGVYIYKIKSNGYIESKKMSLLK